MVRFTRLHNVTPEEIDELDHVNNVVYVQWVQDIAAAHWHELAAEEIRKHYAWVVLKHEIEYVRPALLHDPVTLTTWVESADGVRSVRCVEITHATSNTLLAKARTTWCLLDALTLRPKRIDDTLRTLFLGSSSA